MTKNFAIYLLAVVAAMAVMITNIFAAEDYGDFDPMKIVDLSAPNSVKFIDDPTGTAPTAKITTFQIPSGYCSKNLYGDGKSNDCVQQSVRSSIFENVVATKKNGKIQPKQAWYGWSTYFPNDFKFGKLQTRGGTFLAYWHNDKCAHLNFGNLVGDQNSLYLMTQTARGGYECTPGLRFKVADYKDMLGKWNRFEVYVKWGNENTGEVKVYLDGKFIIHYKGLNLTPGLEDKNYFVHGIYLCCTPGVKTIKETGLYFAAVKRAPTRDGLYTQEDRSVLKQLQQKLNDLGCNVGEVQGTPNLTTRNKALICREFAKGVAPSDLSASTVREYLALYSKSETANLPSGNPLGDTKEVALIIFPDTSKADQSLAKAKFSIKVAEAMAMKTGKDREVNTTFSARVKNNATVKRFDFSMLGQFDFSNTTFWELSFYFHENLKVTKQLEKCGSLALLRFPEGTMHAQIRFFFKRQENKFEATNAKCLIEALPKKLANNIKFLLENFQDVALGLMQDGSVNLISHDGLKEFMKRVARREIVVGM